MDAVVTGLLGVGVGGFLGLATSLLTFSLQGRRERQIRQERAAADFAERRLATYIQFSTTARALRYAALRRFQGNPRPSIENVDSLLTALSHDYYLIELIAPNATAGLAKELRESVEGLWRQSGKLEGQPKPTWQSNVVATRATAKAFRLQTEKELGHYRQSGSLRNQP